MPAVFAEHSNFVRVKGIFPCSTVTASFGLDWSTKKKTSATTVTIVWPLFSVPPPSYINQNKVAQNISALISVAARIVHNQSQSGRLWISHKCDKETNYSIQAAKLFKSCYI